MLATEDFARHAARLLASEDEELVTAIACENHRQQNSLMLVASSSVTDPSVLACLATSSMNVTAEGYPGARYHAGCEAIDPIEQLAIDRARALFGARYVNVQAHSATTANYAVLSAVLNPGDVVLGMRLNHGGHLTHGYSVAYSGTYFTPVNYGLDDQGRIDYDEVAALAAEHRPKLIICGATAYPRTVDFARFRAIADSVGALLMADISHIAGLVAAGLHPSPVDHAHITTTCTHKQLAGPRGGIIMSGRDADTVLPATGRTLAKTLDRAVFPFFQGAPILPAIAAKARAFARAATDEYRNTAQRILDNSAALAAELTALGHEVVTGGSDNHIVLLDLTRDNVSGMAAERALESIGIVVNKNRVPGDTRPAAVTSGVRIGTNAVAQRGLGPREMRVCAGIIHTVLTTMRPVGDRDFTLDEFTAAELRAEVDKLTAEFPLPRYEPSGRP
ncbi:serine hydroxymethyltransferase [Streptomyces griseus]|uniref:serine hydroxymethyltransferase n=1 Tax=Streptomyces griseus TaxID=1911 RepID=UPI0013BE3D50|nr:serine hydroxymethyltransferase [Streptomyces griseus]